MDVIRERRSVRSFKSDKIPASAIKDILESARLAPSGGNAQTYCFGIIDDPHLKIELAHAAGEQMWIATAPIIIACCADISWDLANCKDDDFGLEVNKLRFGEELIKYLNQYSDRKNICKLFQNAAPLIPAVHIFLAAASHGLNACFVGYLDTKRAGEILKLPENMACLFLLSIGYANEIPGEKALKNIDEIVFYNSEGLSSVEYFRNDSHLMFKSNESNTSLVFEGQIKLKNFSNERKEFYIKVLPNKYFINFVKDKEIILSDEFNQPIKYMVEPKSIVYLNAKFSAIQDDLHNLGGNLSQFDIILFNNNEEENFIKDSY